MKERRRPRGRRIAFVILAVMAVVAASLQLSRRPLARYILKRADAHLRRVYKITLSAEKFRVNPWRFSARAEGVRIEPAGATDSIGPELFAEKILVDISPLSLIKGYPHIQRLRISGLKAMVQELKIAGPMAPMKFRVDDFKLENAAIEFKGRIRKIEAELSGVQARIGYSTARAAHLGELQSGSGRVTFDSRQVLIETAAADFLLTPDRFDLEKFRLLKGRSEIAASGSISNYLVDPVFDLKVRAVLGREILGPDPEDAWADLKGNIDIEGSISGTMKDLRISGRLKARELSFGVLPIDGLEANFRGTGHEIQIETLSADLDGARLSASAKIGMEGGIAAEYSIEIADISSLPGFRPFLEKALSAMTQGGPRSIPALKGRASLSGRISGSLKNPEGELRLSAKDLSFGELKGTDLKVDLSLSEKNLRAETISLAFIKGRIEASGLMDFDPLAGTFGNQLLLNIKAQGLDLEPFSALAARFGNKLSFGGEVSAEAMIKGSLRKPDIDFRVDLAQLSFGAERLDSIRLEGSFRMGELSGKSFSAQKGQAIIRGDFKLNPGAKSFSLSASGQDITPASFESLGPALRQLEGVFRVKIEGEGSLALPNFTLDLETDGMRMKDLALEKLALRATVSLPLDRLRNPRNAIDVAVEVGAFEISYQGLGIAALSPARFRLQNGLLAIESFRLGGTGAELNLMGSAAVDPALANSLRMDGWLNLKILEPMLPGAKLDGVFILEARIEGKQEDIKGLVEASLANGRFEHSRLPFPIEEIRLRASAAEQSITLQEFSFRAEPGTLSAAGSVAIASLLPGRFKTGRPAPASSLTLSFSRLNLGKLAAAFSGMKNLEDAFDSTATGSIHLKGLPGKDASFSLTGNITDLEFGYSGIRMQAQKPLLFKMERDFFSIEEAVFGDGTSEVRLKGIIGDPLGKPDLGLSLSGRIQAASFSSLMENATADGRIVLEIEVKGPISRPELTGRVELQDGFLELKDTPLQVSGIQARLDFSGSRVDIVGLQGIANGGAFHGSGALSFAPSSAIQTAALKIDFKDFGWHYPEGLTSRSEGSLSLDSDAGRFRLSGEVRVLQSYYTEDFYPGSRLLGSIVGRSPGMSQELPAGLEKLGLDIRIRTVEPLVVDNNLAKLELAGDIRISGTPLAPSLFGRVENPGFGEIVFGERKYAVERLRLDYNGQDYLNPELSLLAHTSMGHGAEEYEIRLTLAGSLSDFSYTLSSNPPLSEQELALLLLTGRTSADLRTGAMDTLGHQLLLHFAFPLTSPVTESLKSFLKAEEVTIEPLIIASEEDPGARFTFRKRISGRAAVTYSVDITDSQDQTWILDYDLSRSFFLQGFRKDDGSYGLSFRHRFSLGQSGPGPDKEAQRERMRLAGISLTGDLGFAVPVLEKELSGLKEGGDFDYFRMQQAVTRLRDFYHEKDFLRAVINPEVKAGKPGEVSLTLRVDSGPKVQVRFKGEPLPARLVKRVRESWNGRLSEDAALGEAADFMLRELRKKGHYHAQVAWKKGSAETATVYEFEVNKGSRYKIRSLTIQGADAAGPGAVRNALENIAATSGVNGLWTLVFDFRRAANAIRGLYGERGFLDVAIERPEISDDPAAARLDILLKIEEGSPSLVRAVEFEGLSQFTPDELKARLGLAQGGPYIPSGLVRDKNELINLYKSQGFQDVSLEAESLREPGSKEVTIRYHVKEGPRHRVGELAVEGNRRIGEPFILRELGIKRGDPVSLQSLSLAQRNLYDSGLFRAVDVRSTEASSDANAEKRRIVARVEEKPFLGLNYGLRYNSEDKVEGSGQVDINGFLGGGRRALLTYLQNARVKDLRLSLDSPYFFGIKLNTLVSFERRREERFSFVTDETGFSVQNGHRLSRGLILTYLYRLNKIHTYELVPSGPFPFDIQILLSELSSQLVWDSRDDKLDPLRGVYSSLSLTYSPEALGSDLTYYRVFSQFSFYQRLFPGATWASNLRFGLSNAFDQVLIPSKRFFAGGGNSVRGFRQDQIGPRDPFLDEPEGGEGVLILNQEMRFSVSPWLKAVIFYDAGNVYGELGDFAPFKLRHSLGLGIRLASPVGLLRLDYGRNLRPRPGEPRGALFFSIGQAF